MVMLLLTWRDSVLIASQPVQVVKEAVKSSPRIFQAPTKFLPSVPDMAMLTSEGCPHANRQLALNPTPSCNTVLHDTHRLPPGSSVTNLSDLTPTLDLLVPTYCEFTIPRVVIVSSILCGLP